MLFDLPFDQALAQRLPLPLATLYQRAHNAKTPLERHHAAFYLWEAALKLLGAGAVVEFAERQIEDADLAERLQNLARPGLGHWWEFVRRLVPLLAEGGDPGFAAVRDLVLGRTREDLPGAAGLDAVLVEVLDNKTGARATVRLSELFDRLVRYRNREIGHGAAGQKGTAFYDRVGRALLAGVPELLGRLDVLAGRKLHHIAEVRRRGDGAWLVERGDLSTGTYLRIDPLEVPAEEAARLPRPDRLYLEAPTGQAVALDGLRLLHPLLHYDAEANEVLFLNARRGKKRLEYLSYATGRVVERDDLAGETRELLRRVLAADVAADRVEQWAERSQAEEPPAAEPLAAEPVAIKRLGEFELLSKLGQGGMGVVYRAWQPSLGRQVAVKCLFRSGDPRAEARFRREIQALGRAEHPHLVKIFTSGSDGEQWFYAMELVEGATLAVVCDRLSVHAASVRNLDLPTWHAMVSTACAEARLAETPLSAPDPASGRREPAVGREPAVVSVATADSATGTLPSALAGDTYVRHAVTLVQQVAGAAHALHEKGVVHRDIKPGNIIVDALGTSAVLMDLGLAQLADEMDGRLTRTRQFVGTLRYASPQQVLAVGKLDRRSDVYSLGATLWELLTLRPLYGATEETPTPELMEKIQREEPAALRTHHPGIARDLEAIVGKCLEKDPQRRYATAHELAGELGRFLADKPVRARPVGRWERSWRWCRRNRSVASLAATLLLVLIAGVAVSAWLTRRSGREEEQFRSATEQASARAREAELEAQAAREAHEKARQAEREAEEAVRSATERASARAKEAELEAQAPREAQAKNQNPQAQAARNAQAKGQNSQPQAAREAQAKREAEERAARQRTYNAHMVKVQNDWEQRQFAGFEELLNELKPRPGQEDLRGFEWHYWRRLWKQRRPLNLDAKQKVDPKKGIPGSSLAFSADGKRLMLATEDGSIKVWDSATGEQLSAPKVTEDVATRCVGPDLAKLLYAAGSHKDAGVWTTASAEKIPNVKRFNRQTDKLSFNADGKRVAVTGGDGMVTVWDLSAGQIVCRARGASTPAKLSPDGKHLAAAGPDRSFRLWNATTGTELFTLIRKVSQHICSVAFSFNGKRLAIVGDGLLKVWDTTTGQEIYGLTLQVCMPGMVFSPDGKRLAFGTNGGKVSVWEVGIARQLQPAGQTQVQVLAVQVVTSTLSPGLASGLTQLLAFERLQDTLALPQPVGAHAQFVTNVTFSPDGKLLASASADGSVAVWDAATRDPEPVTFKGHTGKVRCVAFSPDGKRLASSCEGENGVKVWDAATGQVALTLTGHTSFVRALAFSADGKRLATAGMDQTVKQWDMLTGEATVTHKGNEGQRGVAFSPDGKRLASVSQDGSVKVWDAVGGQELLTLKGHSGAVNGAAFNPDGTQLALLAFPYNAVRVWNAATGDPTLFLFGHTSAVLSVAFSPDGKRLATASHDRTLKVWDAATGQVVLTLTGRTDLLRSVAFSPDGKRLASGSWDGTVKLWDATTGQEVLTLKGHTAAVTGLVFSPDGKRLASASQDGTVKIWDADSGGWPADVRAANPRMEDAAKGTPATETPAKAELLYSLAWQDLQQNMRAHIFQTGISRNGRLFFGAGDAGPTGAIRVWDLATGKQVQELIPGGDAWFSFAAFLPSGKALVSSYSRYKDLYLWDIDTGKVLRKFVGHIEPGVSFAVAPDGTRLLSWSDDRTVRLWDIETGKELRKLEGHTDKAAGVFSPDGMQVLTFSPDTTLRLWDVETGQELKKLQGHTAGCTGSFFPDGVRALSYSPDGTIRLWDLQTAQEIRRFEAPSVAVRDASVHDGGRLVVGKSQDRKYRLWETASGKLVRELDLAALGENDWSMTASPDGRLGVLNHEDGSVRLLDLATGKELQRCGACPNAKAFSFSPDGNFAVAGSFRTALYVFRLRPRN